MRKYNWFSDKRYLDRTDLQLIRSISSYEAEKAEGEVLDALLRIVRQLRRLRPMGDRAHRELWLPIEGHPRQWLKVVSDQIKDKHFLMLRLEEEHVVCLSDMSSIEGPGKGLAVDILPLLSHIERYVTDTVNWIGQDAASYNGYVNTYLNPAFRRGKIQRAKLEQYRSSSFLDVIDREAAIELLEEHAIPYLFPTMTLRVYRQMRRIAHEAIYGPQDGTDEEVLKPCCGMSEMAGYDLDKVEGFRMWANAVNGFHGMDVVYARLHLTPLETAQGTMLSLWTSSVLHMGNLIKVATALVEAGYPPVLPDADAILALLNGTDTVQIVHSPNDTFSRNGGIVTECELPSRAELGTKAYNALIREIQWEPLLQAELDSDAE